MSKKCNVGFGLDKNKTRIPECNSIKVTLGELSKGFNDTSSDYDGKIVSWNDENGNPQIDIRPKFQRSLIVDDDQTWQVKLLNSVINGLPINDIYLGIITESEFFTYSTKYVLVDGQQRLVTLLKFIDNKLSLIHEERNANGSIELVPVFFERLSKEEKDAICNYVPSIKVCEGPEKVVLEWFKTINQPNHCLTDQELRNSTFIGPFIESAKMAFSLSSAKSKNATNENKDILINTKSNSYFEKFTNGLEPNRQTVLECALKWIAYRDYCDRTEFKNDSDRIEEFMKEHRWDANAKILVDYWKKVTEWASDVFYHDDYNFMDNFKPTDYQPARHANWGYLYHKYHDMALTEDDKKHITEQCAYWIGLGSTWYGSSDGIFEWVLNGAEQDEETMRKYIQKRNFNESDKKRVWHKQGGVDPISHEWHPYSEMEQHHIIYWCNGGQTIESNLVMLSHETHRAIHEGRIHLTPEQVLKAKEEQIEQVKAANKK